MYRVLQESPVSDVCTLSFQGVACEVSTKSQEPTGHNGCKIHIGMTFKELCISTENNVLKVCELRYVTRK